MGLVNQHVERDLVAYAERRLSAARTAQVEAHLAVCAACRAAAAETGLLVDALQAAPAALRGLTRRNDWPAVWARVSASQRSRLPRVAPRLSFYMGLMAVALSAATLAPGTFGIRPAVTAGVVETPVSIAAAANVALTPRAVLTGHSQSVVSELPTNATVAFTEAAQVAVTPKGPATAPTPGPEQ